ncbi:MAG: MFS transporter [Pseudomonadota bacterium]
MMDAQSSSAASENSPGVSPRAAILAFALGAIFFNYAFIQRVSPSVMTHELMRDFSVGAAALGSLSAFYFYAYAGIQLPVGVLTDRFGPRKLMGVAAFFCAFASLAFAYSDSLWAASIARAMVGGTVAFAFVGTMAIAGYWFKSSQYALLAGILQAAGMCGAIFGQALLRLVVEGIGWRQSVLAMAAMALVLCVLVFTLVPRRSESERQQKERPSMLSGLRAVTTNSQSWLCAAIGFGMAATMLGFGGLWAVPWLTSVHGYSTVQAAGIASTLFAGWAIFSPIVGALSDYLGRRNPLLIGGGIVSSGAFALLLFATPQNTYLLIALVLTTGIGGCTMTVAFSMVKELNDVRFSSTSLGLMNMCIVGSGAVMQPLIGVLLDLQWDGTMIEGVRSYSTSAYTFALTSFLVVQVMAVVGALIVRETQCRQVG